MRRLHMLAPRAALADPVRESALAPAVLAAYQSLWHPKLLVDAEEPPTWGELGDPPIDTELTNEVPLPVDGEMTFAFPRPTWDAMASAGRDAFSARAEVLILDSAHFAPAEMIRFHAARNPENCDEELLLDFFALGFCRLGMKVLVEQMGHEDAIDSWSLMSEVKPAAEAFLSGDKNRASDGLHAAFDLLHNSRQMVYPATINWVDIGLFPPGWSLEMLKERTRWQAPINLLATASELEHAFATNADLGPALREAIALGQIAIVGGVYDSRPWTLLTPESRYWQLERATAFYAASLSREIDGFGARSLAMTPDLPEMLSRFHYRHALHASFDGSRIPNFRDPKLHWTAPDGSILEALARVAREGDRAENALLVLADLAKSLMNDRAAVIVIAHWFQRTAPWYQWILRAHQQAAVFGRFETLSDYFLNSSIPDKPTRTHADEYCSTSLDAAGAGNEGNPISRWIDHHQLRGQLEAAYSLASFDLMANELPLADPSPLENAVESLKPNESAQPLFEQIDQVRQQALAGVARHLLAEAPANAGFLVINPNGHTCRARLEFDGVIAWEGLEAPVRAVQTDGKTSAAVVDLHGWGYAWIPQAPTPSRSAPPKTPIASGKLLRNEHVEVEIDGSTGGIRGIRGLKSGYNRIGQQLVHSAGSKQVCKKITIAATGPAFGEIVTEGEIVSDAKRQTLAKFTQRTRLWVGQPIVDVSIRLDPVAIPNGAPSEDYFGCRWAWPDEKASVLAASGYMLEPARHGEIEAPRLIEMRERKLTTQIMPGGLPFHRRISARMMDTRLVASGETRREFSLAIGLDLMHPWSAVFDRMRPAAVIPVSSGPPLAGRTGFLASLGKANIVASRLIPVPGERPVFRMRLVETAGQSTRLGLRFHKPPKLGRLVNARGQLVFDLSIIDDIVTVDLAEFETIAVEIGFSPLEEKEEEFVTMD